MASTGAPIPATMFHGNGHIAKPQMARVMNAMSSHANASRSTADSGALVPAGSCCARAARGESDMAPSLRRTQIPVRERRSLQQGAQLGLGRGSAALLDVT